MADNNNAPPTVEYLRQAKKDLEENLVALVRDEIKMFTEATGVQVENLYATFSRLEWTTVADARPLFRSVLSEISVELDI